jgi:hypothetical protein
MGDAEVYSARSSGHGILCTAHRKQLLVDIRFETDQLLARNYLEMQVETMSLNQAPFQGQLDVPVVGGSELYYWWEKAPQPPQLSIQLASV